MQDYQYVYSPEISIKWQIHNFFLMSTFYVKKLDIFGFYSRLDLEK